MTTHYSPVITDMQVIPVAGHSSMLMNIGGAHAAYFTRNIVILKDSAGNTGVGEAPGGSRSDATAMQYLIPGWTFDRKRPALGR